MKTTSTIKKSIHRYLMSVGFIFLIMFAPSHTWAHTNKLYANVKPSIGKNGSIRDVNEPSNVMIADNPLSIYAGNSNSVLKRVDPDPILNGLECATNLIKSLNATNPNNAISGNNEQFALLESSSGIKKI